MRDEFSAEVFPFDIAKDWDMTGDLLPKEHSPVYRLLSYKTKGEGFFMTVLRKPGMSNRKAWDECLPVWGRVFAVPGVRGKNAKGKGRKPQEKRMRTPGLSKGQSFIFQDWVPILGEYEFAQNNDNVSTFPKCYLPELSVLQSLLRIVQTKVGIAEQEGEGQIPNHALAMSRVLGPDVFPRKEISYGQAIAYLQKEAITLPDAAPCGAVLLAYKGISLGFVKNIGNRANNLHLQEWRIRNDYLPEKVRGISD